MRKYDIVNLLSKQHGFQSYLEICTTSTGGSYANIDTQQLTVRHRLMYRCPDDFTDDLDCVFRTTGPSSHELIRAIYHARGGQSGYDIVFVDPFHTYETSMTDLLGSYCLVRPGGMIVVHDCLPTDPNIVSPEFVPGSWCGVTYQAFVDFTLSAGRGHSYTVDCDFGCGVIQKPETASAAQDLLDLEWFLVRNSDAARFRFFLQNRSRLLRLVDENSFLATFARPERVAISTEAPQDIPQPDLEVAVAAQAMA